MNSLKIGAVIPVFNGELVIDKCLESLLDQSCYLTRIYVIDNASSDGSASLMERLRSERVCYLRQDENLGPTGGFATGMEAALDDGCDRVWLMDQDSTARPDSLEHLLQCMSTDNNIVATAPAKFEAEGNLWIGENVSGGVAPEPILYSGEPFDIDSTLWSGLLVKASAIRRVGLPLKELFGWWCDGEYCFRLRKSGRIVLVPSSGINHHRTGAVHLEYSGYWKHYYYQRNSMYLYLNGHLPSPGFSHIMMNLTQQVAYILLRQDHKFERLRILLTAAGDAFTGRMGRGPAWLH